MPFLQNSKTGHTRKSGLSGIPFSFGSHAHDIYPPDGALLEKLAAATWMRTISEANRRYLTSLAPGMAGKIVKIPIGIPLAGVSKASASFPTAPPYRLLALGRLVAKKGFSTLLEACRLLSAQGFEFHLTLAGDGPQRFHLSRLIRKMGASKSRVNLVGFVPHREVPRLLRESDLFITPKVSPHPETGTASPRVTLEALAHEVPVVGTDVSGLPEVIRPPETGWLVPPADPESLARAVREVCSDPSEARRRARPGGTWWPGSSIP